MAYVNVTVVAPNGREYDAEIDENADTQTLLSNLVEMLKLPHTQQRAVGVLSTVSAWSVR